MKSTIRKISIIGMIIIAVVVFGTRQNIVAAFSEAVDINVDYPDSYDDVKAVKTDIDMILDVFVSEETTTKNKYGNVTNTRRDYYYIVPVYIEPEDEAYYVAVKVPSDKKSAYDDVCDATWAWAYGETDELESVAFEGALLEMEDELYKHYKTWFYEMEWFETTEESKKYALPLVLTPVNLQATKIITIIGGVLFVVFLVMLILSFRKTKEKDSVTPTKLVMTINGINYPMSNFDKVNKLVEKGDKEKAVKELMEVAGISETDANAVILDWYAYWC